MCCVLCCAVAVSVSALPRSACARVRECSSLRVVAFRSLNLKTPTINAEHQRIFQEGTWRNSTTNPENVSKSEPNNSRIDLKT